MNFPTFLGMCARRTISASSVWTICLFLLLPVTLSFSAPAASASASDDQQEPSGPSAPVVPVGEAAYSKPPVSMEEAKIREDLEYASLLMNYGFADYAKMVLDRLKDKGAGAKVKVLELQSLISLGKWDQVRAKIAAEPGQDGPDVQAMKLALADGLYAWGKYAEAQEIYVAFFNKYPSGPPEQLRSFYFDSAYKFSQMMLQLGRKPDALMAYDRLLAAKPERAIERQLMADKAELMMSIMEETGDKTKYKTEVEAIIKKLMWVQDLWFSKSIVFKAHLKAIEGDYPGAMKVLDDFESQLLEMDKLLKEEEDKTGQPLSKLSPMAECRYLMGKVLQQQAEKLDSKTQGDQVKALLAGQQLPPDASGRVRRTDGAVQHFFKVFVDYPNTSWAPDAGSRMRKIQERLEMDFNAKINMKVPPDQWSKVEKMQFEEARTLFRQNQYEQALDIYMKVLNLFPEGETAVAALGELARCAVEMKDEWLMDVVLSYIGERFGKSREYQVKAGDQLLELQGYLKEIGLTNKSEWVVDLFFERVPRHPRVPAMIMRRGDDKYLLKDYEGALQEYSRIEEKYTDTPFYLDALNRKAISQQELQKPAESIKTLAKYTELVGQKDTPESVKEFLAGNYRLGNAYRQLEPPKYLPNAMKYYAEVIKMVTDEKHPKFKFIQQGDETKGVLEGAMFNESLCFSMLTEPAENVKAYKARAVKGFRDLLQKNPKSEYAPNALLRIGIIESLQGNTEEAGKAFDRLQKDYPDSQPAKNSAYLRGDALLKMGRRDEAMKSFKEMFSGSGGKYSDSQVLEAGTRLMEEKEYEIALEAYEKVKGSQDKATQDKATFGRGKCLQGLGRSAEAIAELEGMLAKNPQSGYTPEAAFILGDAYSNVGGAEQDALKRFELFNKAVSWVKKAKKFDKTPKGQRTVELIVGRINKSKALAEEKFGDKEQARSYKGEAVAALHAITSFADPKDTTIRSLIEEAYMEQIPLMIDIEKWHDVEEVCTKYIDDFPNGKFVNEVRSWRTKAKVKLATEGGPAPAEGGAGVIEEVPVPAEDTTPGAEGAAPAESAAAVQEAPAANTNAPAKVPATTPAPAAEKNQDAKGEKP